MKIFSIDRFVLPLPPGHRFPMEKYALVRRRIVESGLPPAAVLCVPDAAADAQVALAHDPLYVKRVAAGALGRREMRRVGFPWSPALVERSRRSVGATIEACRAAMAEGVAVSLAGGTHHASAGEGEGFCVFNDSAVAVRVLLAEGAIGRAVILDCDVHQGNGTALIFADDPATFTFDVYGEGNFPFRKVPCDLGIPVPDGAGDDAYLDALRTGLERLSPHLSEFDLAVYLAGADPFVEDRLGRLAVSKEGLAERDRLVFRACQEAHLPVAVTMAGGYAKDVTDTVDIHHHTVRVAVDCWWGAGAPTQGERDASHPLGNR